jgi:hypothetical protein
MQQNILLKSEWLWKGRKDACLACYNMLLLKFITNTGKVLNCSCV